MTEHHSETERNLDGLHKPSVSMPLRERVLKESLTKRLYAHQGEAGFSGMRWIHTMSLPTKILIPGVAAVVLLFGIIGFTGTTEEAYAKELVDKAIVKVDTLTPEMRENFKNVVNDDLAYFLKEARNADDLKVITREQFMAEFGKEKMYPPADDTTADEMNLGTPVSYLRFSDESNTIAVGLDEDETPVLVATKLKAQFDVSDTEDYRTPTPKEIEEKEQFIKDMNDDKKNETPTPKEMEEKEKFLKELQ